MGAWPPGAVRSPPGVCWVVTRCPQSSVTCAFKVNMTPVANIVPGRWPGALWLQVRPLSYWHLIWGDHSHPSKTRLVWGSCLLTAHHGPCVSHTHEPCVVLVYPFLTVQIHSTDRAPSPWAPHGQLLEDLYTLTMSSTVFLGGFAGCSSLSQQILLFNILSCLLLTSFTSCCPCPIRPCLMSVDILYQNGTALLSSCWPVVLFWWQECGPHWKKAHSRKAMIVTSTIQNSKRQPACMLKKFKQ